MPDTSKSESVSCLWQNPDLRTGVKRLCPGSSFLQECEEVSGQFHQACKVQGVKRTREERCEPTFSPDDRSGVSAGGDLMNHGKCSMGFEEKYLELGKRESKERGPGDSGPQLHIQAVEDAFVRFSNLCPQLLQCPAYA